MSAVVNYEKSLPYTVWNNGNCVLGHHYLLNNYNPGYYGNGQADSTGFTIPPSSVRTIGDEMLEHNISWKYYGEDWNLYVNDPNRTNPTTAVAPSATRSSTLPP